MKFSDYKRMALTALWGMYNRSDATNNPKFESWRLDDIIASFWLCRQDVFNDQCIMELRDYLEEMRRKTSINYLLEHHANLQAAVVVLIESAKKNSDVDALAQWDALRERETVT